MNNRSDILEVMLYNSRHVFLFGPTYIGDERVEPGALIQFWCNNLPAIDLEVDQVPGTWYHANPTSSLRITKEDTIRTFFLGVRMLSAPLQDLVEGQKTAQL